MKANNSKSYVSYLNKWMNPYHRSIGQKPIHAEHSGLTEELKSSDKAPKFKVGDRVRITKYKNIFSKGYTKNWLN